MISMSTHFNDKHTYTFISIGLSMQGHSSHSILLDQLISSPKSDSHLLNSFLHNLSGSNVTTSPRNLQAYFFFFERLLFSEHPKHTSKETKFTENYTQSCIKIKFQQRLHFLHHTKYLPFLVKKQINTHTHITYLSSN